MASIFKPKGSDRYVILYWDENHKRRKKLGTREKGNTQRIANKLDEEVALRKAGLINPKDEARAKYATEPFDKHITEWKKALLAKDASGQHVENFAHKVSILVALIKGADLGKVNPPHSARGHNAAQYDQALAKVVATARLSDLTAERVQGALAAIKASGRSLGTCNAHRQAIVGFVRWCRKTDRLRDDVLFGLSGYNAETDKRHDRRTLGLDELKRLVSTTANAYPHHCMTGPARALLYRLAAETGLRYSEIGSVKPESFNWKAHSVTVDAAYTKNKQTATLPLTDALAADLRAYVATIARGEPVFTLPVGKGADMLRMDLKAAGIPYRDDAGRVFDFHALRCQLATNADAAGVSPRVVQKMMRHSTLELTGRYTRPRAVDVEAAVGRLPSLKPESEDREALSAAGTDDVLLPHAAPRGLGTNRNVLSMDSLRQGGYVPEKR
jgi:integrase